MDSKETKVMDNKGIIGDKSFTMAEAIEEAKRCLNCKVPLCRKGCPVDQNIPEWIHELSMGNLGNAMALINEHSNLPAVCGRVCAHERQCEGHCILNKKDAHIRIGRLEQFIADFDTNMNLTRELIMQKDRGRIAVIGSGPAGLTVAGELARRGFDVEIFEMEGEAGGVLQFGIPEYRLPKSVVASEIKKITNLGVRINLRVTVGPDMNVDQIFARGFDAIFMGTGAGKPRRLPIENPGGAKIWMAIYFLRLYSLYNSGLVSRKEVPVTPGDKVFVVGCGNTAMDAARSAVRMGAGKVTVVYHRDISRMSALRSEYNEAVEEGVEFVWNASVTAVGSIDGRLSSITIDQEGNVFTVEADRLFLAVGSRPASRIVSTTEGIQTDEKGYVLVRDNPYGMTTRKGVFAGGDVTNRPATVVNAMADARQVAQGIARYVDAIRLMQEIDK